MSTGQCAVDPVTGIAGAIYTAWTGDANNGLAAAALVSGSPLRALLAAQIQSIAASIETAGNVNGHSLGTTISWSAGTGDGQISFGAAAPNGALVSAAGCDEGGTITMTTGANTSTGALWIVHFGAAFPHAPAATVQAADAVTGALMYGYQTYVTTTTSALTMNISSPPPNATYKWHWLAKGGS